MKKCFLTLLILCAPVFAGAQQLCPTGFYSFNGQCLTVSNGVATIGGQTGTGPGGKGGSVQLQPGLPNFLSTAEGDVVIFTDPLQPGIVFKCSQPMAGNIATATCSFSNITVSGAGGNPPGGVNTNVQYNNAGAFGGSTKFSWVDSTGTLFTQSPGVNEFWNFQATNGLTGQKQWDIYADKLTRAGAPGNSDVLHFRVLDDSGLNPQDFMYVARDGVDSGACVPGAIISGAYPCQIVIATASMDLTFGAQRTSQPIAGPFAFRVRCISPNALTAYNNDCGMLFGNHASGAQSYTWGQFYSPDAGVNRIGLAFEIVPANATGTNTSFRPSVCNFTVPYTCLVASPNLYFEVADANSSPTASGTGPVFLNVQKTIGTGQVTVTLGDTLTANSITYIQGAAATIVSGFGTTPTLGPNPLPSSMTLTIGTGGAASTGVIGLPTATNGWACHAEDTTTPGVNETKQTGAPAASSCTLTNFNTTTGVAAAWTAGDVLTITAAPH